MAASGDCGSGKKDKFPRLAVERAGDILETQEGLRLLGSYIVFHDSSLRSQRSAHISEGVGERTGRCALGALV
jgi:hypothetical protein